MFDLPENRVSTHPGAILKEDFINPMGITICDAADAMGINRVELSEIVNGRRAIDIDSAKKIAKFSGTYAKFWLDLQEDYDKTKKG